MYFFAGELKIELLKDKAIQTTISTSLKREDNKHLSFNSVENVKVPDKCYKSYIHETNIEATTKKRQASGAPPKTEREMGKWFNVSILTDVHCWIHIWQDYKKGIGITR